MSEPLTVYLCGPMAGCKNFEHVERRANQKLWVKAAFLEEWYRRAMGPEPPEIEFLDPTAGRTPHVSALVDRDLTCVAVATVVLADVWKVGLGTGMEMAHSTKAKTVAAVEDPGLAVNPWIHWHAESVWGTVEGACGRVAELLCDEAARRANGGKT
jgi:hypothetical protein